DPNGLWRDGATYHLHYQHNPDQPVWGNLHWGHASSNDLTTWTHHDLALFPDDLGEPFSGSVVRDVDNTSGFGRDALIAVYTQDDQRTQRQSIACSVDGGRRWTPSNDNPVLSPPTGHKDFRDPKVLWHEGHAGGTWVMLLAVGSEVWVYQSPDLRSWAHTDALTIDTPWHAVTVEVPDLLRVPLEGGGAAWLLTVSVIPPGGARRVTGRLRGVFVDFDGAQLRALGPSVSIDLGRDLYALAAWPHRHGEHPIAVGWIDERPLFDDGPTERCGQLCLPRRIEARATTMDELAVRQLPCLPAADRWRHVEVQSRSTIVDALCVRVQASRTSTAATRVSISPSGNPDAGVHITLDSTVGLTMPDGHHTVIERAAGRTLDVIIDAGTVELFFDDGMATVCELWPHTGAPIAVEVDGPGHIDVSAYGDDRT
ncbi:MAG: glycoside hydrolase family 32 protein, partial [Actinomycetota bacterium]